MGYTVWATSRFGRNFSPHESVIFPKINAAALRVTCLTRAPPALLLIGFAYGLWAYAALSARLAEAA